MTTGDMAITVTLIVNVFFAWKNNSELKKTKVCVYHSQFKEQLDGVTVVCEHTKDQVIEMCTRCEEIQKNRGC